MFRSYDNPLFVFDSFCFAARFFFSIFAEREEDETYVVVGPQPPEPGSGYVVVPPVEKEPEAEALVICRPSETAQGESRLKALSLVANYYIFFFFFFLRSTGGEHVCATEDE